MKALIFSVLTVTAVYLLAAWLTVYVSGTAPAVLLILVKSRFFMFTFFISFIFCFAGYFWIGKQLSRN